ncbi:sphingoid long-chain base transporter rsb1 [Curvularia clavata]|uniref:Sphingoid long-chain base transporter rsb1 n=1 Tax=Curvularia clavata TaxID=95742 RepID=A0A9Q9DNR0_CURCL|nr:sphingoid long-chain base transporter rsb1 [Curvularia clavata]
MMHTLVLRADSPPVECTEVGLPGCEVENTILGYAPNLAANAFFAAFFGLAFVLQLFFGIRYKTWTYMIALGCGCVAECIGYIGRILLYNNPWSDVGFNIQIVLLIFAPAFLAAGIYLTLKHIVIQFGQEWSRLRPSWYTYLFIAADVLSLVMQSAGGALAATADPGEKLLDVGTNIMIAGIIWQVVALAIFGLLVLEYSIRTYRRRDILSSSALALWSTRRFKFFCGGVLLAYTCILVRCIYRIPELLGGWGGELMQAETEFIILEGVMIAITVLAQTVFHPGICFPPLGNTIGKRKNAKGSVSESRVEMLEQGQSVSSRRAFQTKMNPADGPNDQSAADNGAPAAGSVAASTTSAPTSQSTTPMPPASSSQMASSPATIGTTSGPSFPQYSPSTAAILERLQGKNSHAAGSAAFEAKRAEILQSYVTSDKLPTPPPAVTTGRRGRGGKVSTPSGLKTEVGASPTPASSGRASARGRGRGRGGRGGRGGKRKRSDSDEESHNDDDNDDSDVSDSYTPLPTRTKSGRSVNKPVAFVPVIPEPTQGVKRRKSTKTLLAAKCKTCHRETDPANNRIVFCDACSTAYHQYCHDPPIDNEVVTVLEKEFLCTPCTRAKQTAVESAQDLVAADDLSIDQKRAYFSTLSQHQLVGLLLTATIRHPELPVFPPNVRSLIPEASGTKPQLQQHQQQEQKTNQVSSASESSLQYQPSRPAFQQPPATSPANNATPQLSSHSHSELDTVDARNLGDNINQSRTTMDLAGNQYDEDDGYDTDPPAHYPKAGNGLARNMRPESEDLNWLVDDNFEVFSHSWKGDGTGMGADGTLDGLGEGQKVV